MFRKMAAYSGIVMWVAYITFYILGKAHHIPDSGIQYPFDFNIVGGIMIIAATACSLFAIMSQFLEKD